KVVSSRILVVEARFYNDIADALLAGAAKALDEAKATWDIITVPGSLDIVPVQSARALLDYSIRTGVPCGNGILTTDNEAQAWARARLTEQDKGGDAARATLALIALKRQRAKK